jgi:hypothetical protein
MRWVEQKASIVSRRAERYLEQTSTEDKYY